MIQTSIKPNEIVKKLLPVLSFIGFLSFIIYLIVEADQDKDNFLLTLAEEVQYGDKIGHFFLFGFLSFLLNTVLKHKKTSLFGWSLPLGSLLILTFSILEEFSQLAFPSRTFDFLDMTADVLGILFFGWLFRKYKPEVQLGSSQQKRGYPKNG